MFRQKYIENNLPHNGKNISQLKYVCVMAKMMVWKMINYKIDKSVALHKCVFILYKKLDLIMRKMITTS